jgi:hypothetical protein
MVNIFFAVSAGQERFGAVFQVANDDPRKSRRDREKACVTLCSRVDAQCHLLAGHFALVFDSSEAEEVAVQTATCQASNGRYCVWSSFAMTNRIQG